MNSKEYELTVTVTSPADGVVRPGEIIQGHVQIRVLEGFTCNGVKVSLQCRTTGKGNKLNLLVGTVQLFQGELHPGEHQFPFTLTAPKGPFSYTGKIIEVHWGVFATIDISWAVDPTATAPLTLVPTANMQRSTPYFYGAKPTTSGKDKDPNALETATGEAPPATSVWLWIIIFPIVALLIVALIGMILAIPIFALVLSPFIIYFVIKEWLIRRVIGKPNVRVSHQLVCHGDSLSVTLEFVPRKDLKFTAVKAELTCQEIAVSGSGKNASTYRETVYSHREDFRMVEQASLAQAYRRASDLHPSPELLQQVKRGVPYHLIAQIPIPSALPFTLALSSNSIQTKLNLQIEIDGYPDWKKEFTVTVRPGTTIT